MPSKPEPFDVQLSNTKSPPAVQLQITSYAAGNRVVKEVSKVTDDGDWDEDEDDDKPVTFYAPPPVALDQLSDWS